MTSKKELQKQIDRIALDVEPVIEEHHAREKRRDAAMAAHRRRRADGWEPPYARLRRRVDRIEEGQKKRAAYNSIDHSAMIERLERLEGRFKPGGVVPRRTVMVLRLAALEKFQDRVVAAGYAFGLVGGCALVAYAASFVVALCQ